MADAENQGAGGEAVASEQQGSANEDLQARIDAAVENAVAGLKAKNQELLGSNRQLKEQVAELKGLIEDLGGREGVAQLKALRDKAEDDAVAQALAQGDIETARQRLRESVAARYDNRIASLEKELADERQARADLEAEMAAGRVEAAIREAARAAEVDPDMVPFLVDRLKQDLAHRDGRVVAVDNGEPVTDAEGAAKGPAVLIEEMKADGRLPANFFRRATGGGAPGNAGNGSGTGIGNPWSPESYNLTRQGEMLRTNPALARVLAGEAGG